MMTLQEIGKRAEEARNAPVSDYTRITTVGGIDLYEHPVYGDEAAMCVLINGVMKSTGEYDVPAAEDLAYIVEEMKAGRW